MLGPLMFGSSHIHSMGTVVGMAGQSDPKGSDLDSLVALHQLVNTQKLSSAHGHRPAMAGSLLKKRAPGQISRAFASAHKKKHPDMQLCVGRTWSRGERLRQGVRHAG